MGTKIAPMVRVTNDQTDPETWRIWCTFRVSSPASCWGTRIRTYFGLLSLFFSLPSLLFCVDLILPSVDFLRRLKNIMAKLFLLVLLFAVSVKCTSKCYYPDGTIEPDHVPCNQTTTGFSACCDHIDSCTLSGICRGASGWDYRGSCTDSAWNSANCAATQWNQCIIGKFDRIEKSVVGWHEQIHLPMRDTRLILPFGHAVPKEQDSLLMNGAAHI